MADERVISAISNWGPRFISHGVDASDFQQVTAGIDSWDEWCRAWCGAGAEHEKLGRESLGDGRGRSAGAHLSRAAIYYHFGKFLFVQDMDQLRAAHRRAVQCLTDALPHLDPPGERVDVAFEGATLVGVLRRPRGPGPHPAVLLIPGLDSAKEEFPTTEQLFLDRGVATFSLDGPGQGEAEYDLAIRPDWEVPGGAALARLARQPGIDGERLGVWGVSLGGYYAARLASGDERVKACIALAGPYDFGENWDTVALPALTRQAFQVRSKSSSAEEARRRAGELTLDGRAKLITAPLLVVFGKKDRLIPWSHAVRLAEEVSGPVELLMFDDGNHVCTNIPYRHRLHSADWMAERLGVGAE